MAATVAQVMTALKTQLATISGLRTVDYIPDQINPPMAVPALTQVTYHNAQQGGAPQHSIVVTVIVGRASERTAQNALYEFLSYSGNKSIRAAIEADRTLGGVVQTTVVQSGSDIRPITVADATYLVVDFDVLVYA